MGDEYRREQSGDDETPVRGRSTVAQGASEPARDEDDETPVRGRSTVPQGASEPARDVEVDGDA
jgi:hypothetical protein